MYQIKRYTHDAPHHQIKHTLETFKKFHGPPFVIVLSSPCQVSHRLRPPVGVNSMRHASQSAICLPMAMVPLKSTTVALKLTMVVPPIDNH